MTTSDDVTRKASRNNPVDRARTSYEAPAPGNPHNITVKQHIRSKACIKRFVPAGTSEVGVLEKDGGKPRKVSPASKCFCAERVWDERTERSKWTVDIENRFQLEATVISNAKAVTDHAAVTDYFALWYVRSQLAAAPLEDMELCVYPGQRLTVEHENLLERHGRIFVRPSTAPDRAVVPGRLMSFPHATDQHRAIVGRLRHMRWGVLRAPRDARFICPDDPGDQLYMPLSPWLALAGGHRDGELTREMVLQTNLGAYDRARRLTFGRFRDIERFLETLTRRDHAGG